MQLQKSRARPVPDKGIGRETSDSEEKQEGGQKGIQEGWINSENKQKSLTVDPLTYTTRWSDGELLVRQLLLNFKVSTFVRSPGEAVMLFPSLLCLISAWTWVSWYNFNLTMCLSTFPIYSDEFRWWNLPPFRTGAVAGAESFSIIKNLLVRRYIQEKQVGKHCFQIIWNNLGQNRLILTLASEDSNIWKDSQVEKKKMHPFQILWETSPTKVLKSICTKLLKLPYKAMYSVGFMSSNW